MGEGSRGWEGGKKSERENALAPEGCYPGLWIVFRAFGLGCDRAAAGCATPLSQEYIPRKWEIQEGCEG